MSIGANSQFVLTVLDTEVLNGVRQDGQSRVVISVKLVGNVALFVC
jgi:hypothetical protein